MAKCLKTGDKLERDYIYIESETFVTVIKDGFKYTYFDGDGGREMLIDLTADYGEMKNIASEYPTKMAELKKIAMGYERKIPATKIEKSKNKQSIKNRQNKKININNLKLKNLSDENKNFDDVVFVGQYIYICHESRWYCS